MVILSSSLTLSSKMPSQQDHGAEMIKSARLAQRHPWFRERQYFHVGSVRSLRIVNTIFQSQMCVMRVCEVGDGKKNRRGIWKSSDPLNSLVTYGIGLAGGSKKLRVDREWCIPLSGQSIVTCLIISSKHWLWSSSLIGQIPDSLEAKLSAVKMVVQVSAHRLS